MRGKKEMGGGAGTLSKDAVSARDQRQPDPTQHRSINCPTELVFHEVRRLAFCTPMSA